MFSTSSLLAYICCIILCSRANAGSVSTPPNFPSNISLRLGTYENWANILTVSNLWIATPSTVDDVVKIANWAHINSYKVRATGFMHNWSPLTVTSANQNNKKVILVDMKKNLVHMKMRKLPNSSAKAVKVQTGASMLDLLTFLEKNESGLNAVPSTGDLTVGGVLAIGGHGTGALAFGETVTPGQAYGTLSNLIQTFTSIVWSPAANSYVTKTFTRSDIDSKAFLVHLGRAFITEVILIVADNYNLRCISRTDISGDELFAKPSDVKPKTRTFASFLDKAGRVEIIAFNFSKTVWLKTWTISPKKPNSSRKVSGPFNYPFSDNFSEVVATLIGNVTNKASVLTPLLSEAQSITLKVGLALTLSADIWGLSKNLLLYVKPTTLKITSYGFVIITGRSNIQNVVHIAVTYVKNLINDYAKKGIYPLSQQMEIRATQLDQPGVLPNAESPALSPIHPVKDHAEFDTAIWFGIITFPGASHLFEAMSKIESFLYRTFDGKNAFVRVEWSKGWAYTQQSAWSNATVYTKFVPSSFPSSSSNDGWNWAVSTLDKYDPHRIFTNDFLDKSVVRT